ncbi:restriction endonuclease subunit R [Rhodothermaceae bacterium RA]|nr:restriction endonuclease subunit R [Rhodothermaceae bacterium RA]
MIKTDKKVHPKRQNERQSVELPLLKQLKDLGWTVLDLEMQQDPADSYRTDFTQVVLEPRLRQALARINPWLEEDQIDELVRRITPGTGSLLENNQHVLDLLLKGSPVDRNRQTGEQSPTAYYIDFDDQNKNDFLAVCQFKVRILGTEKHIIPDVVCFINGLPVVVIECKSPKAKEPIPEAIDQLLRYSEQRGEGGEGNKALFYYNQFVVATARQQAKFGTISSRIEKHFFRWADPYPRTVEDIREGSSAPNDQRRLVAGMLDRRNLLDLICTFTLFTENDKGQRIKIVGRYQQFRAVKKTVQRLLDGKNKAERSGIIWHTQGSGKSLTMVFLVRELYRLDAFKSWKVVFVTDRTQLEEQLTTTTQSIGKTIQVADSIKRLKELLRTDSSDLIMAMIHKFQEKELETSIFPELNPSPNILVLTDEAHRSQYSLLAANLDRAIPNATEIAFTGTPIDKTEKKYGDYIDKYTMRQSIEDGVTLEIVYEGRTNNAEVDDQAAADALFEDVFSEYTLDERLQALGYGSRQAYLEAEDVIKKKAEDMVRHYVEHVFPNGFKAQVVATSQEAAHRYGIALHEALRKIIAELEANNPRLVNLDILRQLKVAVVISGVGHNDRPHLKQYDNEAQRKQDVASFKMAFGSENEDGLRGDVGILVVNNMLLTGFDAPIEQVMYLDRVITAHNLLQAIARVNRVYNTNKEKGFVVDYVGIGHHLKRALDVYYEREQKEIIESLSSPEQEIAELKQARAALWELLKQNGIEDLNDYDAFFDLFYDEDVRFEYITRFRRFTKAFNVLLPRKEALDYLAEYLQFAEINVQAMQHLRDGRMSMKGIPDKLRKVVDAHLRDKGIEQKVAPISIMDEDFFQHVEKRKRTKTKAAAIEHALRHHIEVELADDPDLQASFAEALEAIIQQFKDNWERIREELEKLRERIRNAAQEETYGLHRKKQMPIFRVLRNEIIGTSPERVADPGQSYTAGAALSEDEVSTLVQLTQEITGLLETELNLSGFWTNVPAQNRLKGELQKRLLAKETLERLPSADREALIKNYKAIISRIMEVAERNHDIILYA